MQLYGQTLHTNPSKVYIFWKLNKNCRLQSYIDTKIKKNVLSITLFHKVQRLVLIHGYNTRYASKQNLCKPKERANSGKQTVAFPVSFLWNNISVDLKNLVNVFNLHYLLVSTTFWNFVLKSSPPLFYIYLILIFLVLFSIFWGLTRKLLS